MLGQLSLRTGDCFWCCFFETANLFLSRQFTLSVYPTFTLQNSPVPVCLTYLPAVYYCSFLCSDFNCHWLIDGASFKWQFFISQYEIVYIGASCYYHSTNYCLLNILIIAKEWRFCFKVCSCSLFLTSCYIFYRYFRGLVVCGLPFVMPLVFSILVNENFEILLMKIRVL